LSVKSVKIWLWTIKNAKKKMLKPKIHDFILLIGLNLWRIVTKGMVNFFVIIYGVSFFE
jgi:hypothetical protein